jgi:signal transduction histidine kinase
LWAAALNVGIGTLVTLAGLHRPGHAPFAALCGALATWNLGYALAAPVFDDTIAFRIMYLGVALIGPFSLHFILEFTSNTRKPLWRLLFLTYGCTAGFWAAVLSGLYFVTQDHYLVFRVVLVVFLFSLLVLGLTLLWRAMARAESAGSRTRFTLCFGAGVFAAGAGLTDFLPGFGLPAQELGHVLNVLYVVIISIAILKHRMLDVAGALRRAVVWMTSIVVVTSSLVVLLIVFGAPRSAVLFGLPALALVVVLLLNVFWSRLLDVVERLMFPRRTAYRQALTSFGNAMPVLDSAQRAAEVFLATVLPAMGVERGVVGLRARGRSIALRLGWEHGAIRPDAEIEHDLERWAERPHPTLIVEDLERAVSGRVGASLPEPPDTFEGNRRNWYQKLLSAMQRQGAEIVATVGHGEQSLGLLGVGPRTTGEGFDSHDAELLASLANQLGLCLAHQDRLRQLHESERLAELGRVVSSVSHEIKNPLSAIRSAGQLLVEGRNVNEPEELASIIVDEAGRLDRLLSRYLEFVRPVQPETASEDLERITRKVIELFTVDFGDEMIQVEVEEPLPPVEVDAELYRQVLVNLLQNARQASPRESDIRVRLSHEKNTIKVGVIDSGQGMNRDQAELAFTPFYSTKDRGSGLGLAIARQIAEAHGGSLELESVEGQGTTAVLILPCVEEVKA